MTSPAHRARAALVAAMALLVLAGCGSSTPGQSGNASSSATAHKDITIRYEGGQITPVPGKVQVAIGTQVHLTVTSDVAEEVHNHYNDKEVEVPAGGTATFDFVVTVPGVYEIELHHADKVLMQLQVG